jgi:alkylation response protein AidB-like acyl-CoA dehydrogenase
MGLNAADTSELVFEDCRVPVSNLLGQEGKGVYYMMQKNATGASYVCDRLRGDGGRNAGADY